MVPHHHQTVADRSAQRPRHAVHQGPQQDADGDIFHARFFRGQFLLARLQGLDREAGGRQQQRQAVVLVVVGSLVGNEKDDDDRQKPDVEESLSLGAPGKEKGDEEQCESDPGDEPTGDVAEDHATVERRRREQRPITPLVATGSGEDVEAGSIDGAEVVEGGVGVGVEATAVVRVTFELR